MLKRVLKVILKVMLKRVLNVILKAMFKASVKAILKPRATKSLHQKLKIIANSDNFAIRSSNSLQIATTLQSEAQKHCK